MGILIEHYAGAMPLWLAPEQMRILPISEKTNDYAGQILNQLKNAGFRCDCDYSGEKIGAKIARTHADKVPYMLVVGPKEAETNTVNIRTRGTKETKQLTTEELITAANEKIKTKKINPAL